MPRLFLAATLAATALAAGDLCRAADAPASTVPAAAGATSDIKRDEEVVFFPTYAHRPAEGETWTVAIHGSIFEPESNSLKRAAALEVLRASLGLSKNEAGSEIFRRRAAAFLVDNQRGKKIVVRLGDQIFAAGTSEANGHFSAALCFSPADARRLRRDADANGWLGFQAVARRGDSRTFAGRVQWIDPEGRSIVSDIDDTIKRSDVQDRQALLANTLLRPFQPVPEMAAAYRRWAAAGAAVHYVSASPWQLYQSLADFCGDEDFPPGTFDMKLFRVKDASALSLFGSPEGYKTAILERLLGDFPRRRFTLVGDSGEQDPEIYAAVARKHAEQIEHIFIRNVGGRGAEAARFEKAFEGVPAARWKVFKSAAELPERL